MSRRTRAAATRRLIVVSNRLPVTLRRSASDATERVRSTGGLVAALEPTLERVGGVWVGWPGIELRPGEGVSKPGDPYRIEPVNLTRDQVKRYYYGFSNVTLWPLLHTMTGRADFDPADWQAYREVNEHFAEVTARQYRKGDLVWVHDYQLLLLPADLRRHVPRAAIGFFLHIPFPPYDVFRLLPWAKPVLRGLLAADLIGFHVDGYVRNFLDCAQRLLGAQADQRRKLVRYPAAVRSRVAAFPLGIDYQHYATLARRAPSAGFPPSVRIVLGVDRLDYTKGIPQRIRAFARLLDMHPEHRQQVTMLQVAVPSRSEVPEYRHLKREIDELVGRVNGRFGTATWTPIHYLYRSIPQERLAALYRDADVALITPVRDGMNLVAKEYVACQVRDPGVLVLSYMAGAAETMAEALLVHPYNIVGTAEALHQALTMPEEERRERMAALRKRERRTNVRVWARVVIERLVAAARDANRDVGAVPTL